MKSGVILAYVQDMRKQELYNIYCKDSLLYERLTEEEYFDKLEDLARDFYENGVPCPEDLRTEITPD